SLNNPVILIAGGRDKGLDFRELLDVISEKVKYLILMGETADKLKNLALKKNYSRLQKVNYLEEAVKLAYSKAESGDVILLSPACASFDMYENYAHRGKDFATHVNALGNR
ncbi:MAG: UDP-N-acetylmuramoyl-L-alanine--D-glutamate ligase, partial [Proteobacteria bacterium]|nr:UDP-N-acetylmuramoyl-L-alanine--D-glutamate ligase [Pseudomonadota bacterium]